MPTKLAKILWGVALFIHLLYRIHWLDKSRRCLGAVGNGANTG
jgi:hypothetical protein